MSGKICRETYCNYGSYLRSRGYDKAICDLIDMIENGKIHVGPFIPNGPCNAQIAGTLEIIPCPPNIPNAGSGGVDTGMGQLWVAGGYSGVNGTAAITDLSIQAQNGTNVTGPIIQISPPNFSVNVPSVGTITNKNYIESNTILNAGLTMSDQKVNNPVPTTPIDTTIITDIVNSTTAPPNDWTSGAGFPNDYTLATTKAIGAFVESYVGSAEKLTYQGDGGNAQDVDLVADTFNIEGTPSNISTAATLPSANNPTLTIDLVNTGVTAGSYGSQTISGTTQTIEVPTITIDQKGRVTSAIQPPNAIDVMSSFKVMGNTTSGTPTISNEEALEIVGSTINNNIKCEASSLGPNGAEVKVSLNSTLTGLVDITATGVITGGTLSDGQGATITGGNVIGLDASFQSLYAEDASFQNVYVTENITFDGSIIGPDASFQTIYAVDASFQNITGDLTGNVTGSAGTAATVTDAAQPAITSVGTLTELQVDNININSNAITSTNTNGDIDITPDGSGKVNISKVDIDAGSIDGTKIGASTPDTGAFTELTVDDVKIDNDEISSTGNLIIIPSATGPSALLVGASGIQPRETGSGITAIAQVEGQEQISKSSVTITSNRSQDALGARLNFARTKTGATQGGVTSVSNNDEYGGIYFYGADGTDTNSCAAQINAIAQGTPSSTSMPGKISLKTTPLGGTAPSERMAILNDGQLLQTMKPNSIGTDITGGVLRTIIYSGSIATPLTGNFEIEFIFSGANANWFMVEIMAYHGLYNGNNEYVRVFATKRTSGAGVHQVSIIDDLTGNASFSSTGTNVTIQVPKPNSQTNTVVPANCEIIYKGILEPRTVNIL